MAPADVAPVLPRVRDALVRRVEEASLRQAAREVGMSPTGLRKFLDGAYPFPATRLKLERWYVREAGRDEASPDTAAALSALDVLVRTLPPRERASGAHEVISAIAESFDAAREKRPAWLTEAERRWPTTDRD